jgi:hypothetical protein
MRKKKISIKKYCITVFLLGNSAFYRGIGSSIYVSIKAIKGLQKDSFLAGKGI